MSDFQYQLWSKMIDTINDYLVAHKITFGEMVFKLEHILNLAEIQDAQILNKTEDFWWELEKVYASNLDAKVETNLLDVKDSVEKMRAFLVKTADKVKEL